MKCDNDRCNGNEMTVMNSFGPAGRRVWHCSSCNDTRQWSAVRDCHHSFVAGMCYVGIEDVPAILAFRRKNPRINGEDADFKCDRCDTKASELILYGID
jgi:transposase-like protein